MKIIIRIDSLNNLTLHQKDTILKNSEKINEDLVFVDTDIYNSILQKQDDLSFSEKTSHFSKSIIQWAKGGFHKVSKEAFNKRIEICNSCEFWDDKGNMGMGKCGKCGCGRGKHWFAHEQCPIGLWGIEPLT